MGILDEIKSSEIETLHLSNVPDDYFETTAAFVDAMSANTSITKVIFDKDFLACSNAKERADIVGTIGMLPNVKAVIFRDSLLMVGVCVKELIKNAGSLEELTMENCVLQGVAEHFDLLRDALQGSTSIKTLHIHDCTAPNESVDLDVVMGSLKGDLSIDISGDGCAK
jgi:isocitrate dehydrogenase kinase/phosphatase